MGLACTKKLRIYFLLIVCLHVVDIHVTRKKVERLSGTRITISHEILRRTEAQNRKHVAELHERRRKKHWLDAWRRIASATAPLYLRNARLYADRRTRRNASRKMNAISKLGTAESQCCDRTLCELFELLKQMFRTNWSFITIDLFEGNASDKFLWIFGIYITLVFKKVLKFIYFYLISNFEIS